MATVSFPRSPITVVTTPSSPRASDPLLPSCKSSSKQDDKIAQVSQKTMSSPSFFSNVRRLWEMRLTSSRSIQAIQKEIDDLETALALLGVPFEELS